MLCHGCLCRDFLSLGQFRQWVFFRGFPVLRLRFQGSTEAAFQFLKALAFYRLSFCRKGYAAAVKGSGHGFVSVGLRRCGQQFHGEQEQDIPFAFRQAAFVRFYRFGGGDNGVVVGNFLAVQYAGIVRGEVNALCKVQCAEKPGHDIFSGGEHIVRKVLAVRPGGGA